MRLLLIVLFVVAFFPAIAVSGVIVNEVMANEPGSHVLLEWIELYNNSDSAVSMADYVLDAGGSEVTFPSDLILEPEQFYIVCRRLYGDSASPGFENTWGDSSGVWGDTEFEAGIPVPWQASFSLRNPLDYVFLILDDVKMSSFNWSTSGSDGVSWERVYSDSTKILQCEDIVGSTPGKRNSVAAITNGLVITRVSLSSSQNLGSRVHVTAENVGTETVSQFVSTVLDRNGLEVHRLELEYAVAPDSSVSYVHLIDYDPKVYIILSVVLSDNSGALYDASSLVLATDGFPPVVLSEFLANPQDEITTEWIELWNGSDTTINIGTWQISDSIRVVPISSSEILLNPGEYIVLADDSVEFVTSYPTTHTRVIQVSPWPTLNNTGDRIDLTDEFGILADAFLYQEVFANNHTWSHVHSQRFKWGRSADPGGTPGSENRITIFEDASVVSLEFYNRQVIAGGRQLIYASAPLGHKYSLKVFDRQGRVVRTFAENADFLAESYLWNGTTDSGARLPVGLYIVYFEVPGVGSAKETVAIVR